MARPDKIRHLDAEALAKLGNLQLRVRRVVEGALAGLHRSPHRGSSIEFAEHKEYAPGDDLRRLDWKAYGKFDRYYIREYEDETELKGYLLLDCSGSMGYGKPLTKLGYGSVLVGSLAYLLSRQRDQPGLIAFSDRMQRYVPPRSRASHTGAVLDVLGTVEASGDTDFERVLTQVTEVAARRSLVVIVSDMFDRDRAGTQLLRRLRARGHHVVLFHLLHPDEIDLPFTRVAMFGSMEDDRQVLVDPAGIRQVYQRKMESFCRQLEGTCRETQVLYRRVTTADPLEKVLLDLLQRRPR